MRRGREKLREYSDRTAVLGFLSLVVLEGVLWIGFLASGIVDVGETRIISVSGLVVQVDSFLGLGYLGGLFGYGSVMYQKNKHFPHWWNFFVLGFVGFGGSSILALAGALTGYWLDLMYSLSFLLYGIFVAVVVVYRLHTQLSR